jgi:glycosyltransferase involved in cell wall biosynthesis
MNGPRFLFLPVSGPGGAGEFFRSVAVAHALERRWPGCEISFVVSRGASYAQSTAFRKLLVDRSPTHESDAVLEILRQERPDVAVFDSSGRVVQYREAKRQGTRVVYVSSRASARRRGFRLRRMRWLDQHWIAQPRFLGGDLRRAESAKARLMSNTEVLFLEVLHEPPDLDAAARRLTALGLGQGQFAVCCPGGGGTFADRPDPASLYFEAASEFTRQTGTPVLAVLGSRYEPPASVPDGVHLLQTIPNGELMALLGQCRMAMLNGGSLLVQAIAQHTPCVAAPIADDQPGRIERCAALGLVRPALLERAALTAEAVRLCRDDAGRQQLSERAAALDLRNGLDVAVDAVAGLLRERDIAVGSAAPASPPSPASPEGGGRLRIMHVILSRGFAGSERAVAESCNAMCSAHDVTLVIRRDHRRPSGASIRDHIDPRVKVAELPAYWFTRRRLGEAIRASRPDVIHTHLRRGTRYVVQLATGVPHVCTLHVSLNGPHYLRTDGLICISRWQQQTLPAERPPHVFLIPNSHVPQPRLEPARRQALRRELGAGDEDFLVGGVGRLSASKGFDVLLRAFAKADLPAARLAIIGEGRERARLERLAGERVRLAGYRHDAKDCYQAFDLFVSPSRSEPFGRVIIEALDGGAPVIATDVLGPRDTARDYPIELVPPDDVDALAKALERAYARPRERRSPDLSDFHVDAIAARILEAYRQVISARVRS